MLLKDLHVSNDKRIAKINKALKEAFGFTLASEIKSGKLNQLYKKVADDLYNLKLDLGSVRDKEYTQKLLIKEGLKILIDREREKIQESTTTGPGSRAYERVLSWLAEFVYNACEVGDEYEEAIRDAMKQYRSSKFRFDDNTVEFDLRERTAHCTGVEPISDFEPIPAYESKEELAEKAPPGMEDWIKDRKEDFKDQYGDDWEEVLYATAWERYNKKNESIQENEECPKVVTVRRTMHLGNKVEEYEGEVVDSHSNGALKIKYETPEGEVVTWLPTSGSKLSGTYYDEEIVENSNMKKGLTEDPGHSVLDIIEPAELDELRTYLETDNDTGFFDSGLYDKFYEYYLNSGQMPYGVAKARTGDPVNWTFERVMQDYGDQILPIEEGDPDRYAERDWVKGLEKEQRIKDRMKRINRPRTLEFGDEPSSNDYFSYMSRKKTMKEGYVKKLRRLLEAEVEQAESLIAARGFSQELQDMIEKLGRLVNEDLPAVSEQMRDAYGADVATGFEDTVNNTLSGIMDTLRDSKQDIDNSVSSIADGGVPSAAAADMDDADFGDEDELEIDDLDVDADVDLDVDSEDDFGGAEEGPDLEEPLGRAKKESVQRKKAALKKQINEMQARIARLKKRK